MIEQILLMKMGKPVAVFLVVLSSWPRYECAATDSVVEFNVKKHILGQENIFAILATSPQ